MHHLLMLNLVLDDIRQHLISSFQFYKDVSILADIRTTLLGSRPYAGGYCDILCIVEYNLAELCQH